MQTSTKYKLLISDVDGTLVPYGMHDIVPQPVREAIHAASSKIAIGLATARPLFIVKPVMQQLALTAPCVVNGGAQVVDSATYETLWEQQMLPEDVRTVIDILLQQKMHFIVNDDGIDYIKMQSYRIHKPYNVYIDHLPESVAEEIVANLSHIPTIAVLKAPAWTDGTVGVIISHVAATKLHGIEQVMKIMNVKKGDVIGVGDGLNDFPLLMAAGLKVAMGNANNDLKAIADYVAPSAKKNGMVDVIEKFVLHP